jgi:hypothetical protein
MISRTRETILKNIHCNKYKKQIQKKKFVTEIYYFQSAYNAIYILVYYM